LSMSSRAYATTASVPSRAEPENEIDTRPREAQGPEGEKEPQEPQRIGKPVGEPTADAGAGNPSGSLELRSNSEQRHCMALPAARPKGRSGQHVFVQCDDVRP
jgi:hypothetical protein